MTPRSRFIRYMLIVFAVALAIWAGLYVYNASAAAL